MKNLFLMFLKEEATLLSDSDLYSLYRTYRDKAFIACVNGNNRDHLKYKEYAEVLREEVVRRC